jgi:hypothetical protein
VAIEEHVSVLVTIEEHVSVLVAIEEHVSALVAIEEHVSALVTIEEHVPALNATTFLQYNSAKSQGDNLPWMFVSPHFVPCTVPVNTTVHSGFSST